MKLLLALLALALFSGCAAKAIVSTDSCHKIDGTDKSMCEKVEHIW